MAYGEEMKVVITPHTVTPKILLNDVFYGSAFRIGEHWYLLLDYRDENGDIAALHLTSQYFQAAVAFFDDDQEVDEVRQVTISL